MIILEILESAGVKMHFGAGNEVNICCPFCTMRDETADTRFRLGINAGTGAAQCFNCHWKGRGVAYTAKCLCEAFGIKFNSREFVRERREKKIKAKPAVIAEATAFGLPAEFESFSTSLDEIGNKAKAYLKRRHVSVLQIIRHTIGYAAAGDMSWRILFPVRDRDNIVHGCVGRDFSGVQKPKYLNTLGMTKILWNAHRRATTAVVVEGPMDALRVETALLQTQGIVAVARLGSIITQPQLDQLKEYERIIVFPDFDRAGVQGATELCTRCDARGISTFVVIPPVMNGRDPGNMDDEEILYHLACPGKWSTANEQRLRLSATRNP